MNTQTVEIKHEEALNIATSDNYSGTLLLHGRPINFTLRSPIMEDLSLAEELTIARKEKTGKEITNSMYVMIIFSLLCTKWGNADHISLDDLLKMPINISKEVTKAVANFRDLMQGEE